MNKKRLHLQLSSELKEDLQKEAKDKGISLNGYIRMILLNRNMK